INIPKESPYWAGTTWMAWGPESVAELSQELERQVVNNKAFKDKVTVKGAITEGQPVPFATALTMPTRAQALGQVVAAILGPAEQIAGALTGAAGQIAGQVQAISERKAPEGGAPAAEQPAAPAT